MFIKTLMDPILPCLELRVKLNVPIRKANRTKLEKQINFMISLHVGY